MTTNQLVSFISFKILIAVVLTVAMTSSLLYLAQDLHAYLEAFDNGDLLQLVSFSLLFALSGVGLHLLLTSKKVKTDSCSTDTSIGALLSCNMNALAINFVRGFLTGLGKESEKNNKPTNCPIY